MSSLFTLETNKSITAYLNAIESNLSEEDFVHLGINFWPIIRMQIAFFLVSKNQKSKVPSVLLKKEKKIRKKTKRINIESDLFITHENYSIDINGKTYDRVMEQLISKSKYPVVIDLQDLEIYEGTSRSSLGNLSFPVFFIKAISFLLGLVMNIFLKRISRKIRSIQAFNLKNNEKVISSKDILTRMAYIFLLSKYLTYLMKKYKSSRIYQSMYYDNFGLAAGLAADSIGLVNNCVQHGGQSEHNPAFGNWSIIPKEGYQVMPDNFLCWDVSSSLGINLWAKKTKKHKTIIEGYGWIEIWKNIPHATSEEDSFLNNSDKQKVLVTLQPSVDLNKSYVHELILSNTASFIWILKIHPRQNSQEFINKLELEYKDQSNVFIKSSETPLPYLLVNSDLHVTFYSSSVYEAKYCNVPSILVDKRGLDYFSYLIEEGSVFYAQNISEFNKIQEIIKNKNKNND